MIRGLGSIPSNNYKSIGEVFIERRIEQGDIYKKERVIWGPGHLFFLRGRGTLEEEGEDFYHADGLSLWGSWMNRALVTDNLTGA